MRKLNYNKYANYVLFSLTFVTTVSFGETFDIRCVNRYINIWTHLLIYRGYFFDTNIQISIGLWLRYLDNANSLNIGLYFAILRLKGFEKLLSSASTIKLSAGRPPAARLYCLNDPRDWSGIIRSGIPWLRHDTSLPPIVDVPRQFINLLRRSLDVWQFSHLTLTFTMSWPVDLLAKIRPSLPFLEASY